MSFAKHAAEQLVPDTELDSESESAKKNRFYKNLLYTVLGIGGIAGGAYLANKYDVPKRVGDWLSKSVGEKPKEPLTIGGVAKHIGGAAVDTFNPTNTDTTTNALRAAGAGIALPAARRVAGRFGGSDIKMLRKALDEHGSPTKPSKFNWGSDPSEDTRLATRSLTDEQRATVKRLLNAVEDPTSTLSKELGGNTNTPQGPTAGKRFKRLVDAVETAHAGQTNSPKVNSKAVSMVNSEIGRTVAPKGAPKNYKDNVQAIKNLLNAQNRDFGFGTKGQMIRRGAAGAAIGAAPQLGIGAYNYLTGAQ